ncbi:MAG TPA: exodeoxyribonuclease VII small subunit [Anaerolineaceae bacterium]|nr:exodeoxyribonuclease VII small subunit [Anaerolineaceae bacterium]HQC63843.1 exodeoxyribonuclease VII small subunit [Anaerolineaceae bacterium]
MTKTDPTQSFESSFAQLQDVISKLENADLPLEEAIKLYEEGKRLSKLCSQILESARLRVTTLSETELNESPTD